MLMDADVELGDLLEVAQVVGFIHVGVTLVAAEERDESTDEALVLLLGGWRLLDLVGTILGSTRN